MTAERSLTPPTATEINDVAARWLHKIDIGAVRVDDRELQSWLASNPRHYVAYRRLELSWNRTAILKDLPAARLGVDPYASHLEQTAADDVPVPPITAAPPLPHIRPRTYWPQAVAATLVVAVLIAALYVYDFRWSEHLYATAERETAHYLQSDGSVIYLNALSTVRVRYSPFGRNVDLLKGEGLFTVAKDKRRPFDVHAAGTTVRAVGTEFSVRLRSASSLEVLVSHGTVAVNPPSSQSLEAGTLAVVAGDTMSRNAVDAETIARRLSWRESDGTLTSEGQTLASLVNELNRRNTRQILITDAHYAQYRLGGAVDTSAPEKFVQSVRQLLRHEGVTDSEVLQLQSAPPDASPAPPAALQR